MTIGNNQYYKEQFTPNEEKGLRKTHFYNFRIQSVMVDFYINFGTLVVVQILLMVF